MDYLSFDLRLGEWDSQRQTGIAEVLQSPAGEGARYSFQLDVDIDAVSALTRLSPKLAVRLGRHLAVSVLSQQSLTLWYESYQVARERHRGLRLRLHIDSWELSRLPWELLYDSRRGDFLVFDPMVSVVRYIRLYSPPPGLRRGRRLRVLALAASPKGEAQLDWRREFAVLQQAVAHLADGNEIDIVFRDHITHDGLHAALCERNPDVVHYVGHAGYDQRLKTGLLLLESESGDMAPLPAPDAARLLRRYGVSLVVLNACETAKGAWAGLGPALVRREIPAVVAMQWPVEDQAAIRFSAHFYRALAQGRTVDECIAEGRTGASAVSHDPMDWGAPVLFLRSASGRLWSSGEPLPEDAYQETYGPPSDGTANTSDSVNIDVGEGPLFKTRGPLTSASDGELIIDRPELRRALRLVQQPSITQYVAILSARQMGKTTLLFRLMDLVRPYYPCVFIDLSVLRGQDSGACYRFVASRLLSQARAAFGDGIPRRDTERVEDSVGFLDVLTDLAHSLPVSRALLLLDEVGALTPEASDSFFNTLRTVFTQGRGLKGDLAKYLFVFSGAVDLYGLTYGSNSPLNICEKIYLHDLAIADVEQLVGLFKNLGVTVPKTAAQRIYELTGGHPYLTMRMCALLEESHAKRLTVQQIETAAQQMLVEDDNIHHLLRELEARPLERKRLRQILLEGRNIPFSRNDPCVASLEMIGALKPAQPCQVRNVLYERALRPYLEQAGGYGPGQRSEPSQDAPSREQDYQRLADLRQAALNNAGTYTGGKAWETFATSLFSTVPAFTPYANVTTQQGHLGVLLAINGDAEGAGYWQAYEPAILVERADMNSATGKRIVAEALGKAEAHDLSLVILVASPKGKTRRARLTGTRGERHVVTIDDEEIERLIEEQGDLDALLRRRVLEARLQSL